MTRVLHVVDATCQETQAQVLEALRARSTGGTHAVCSIDAGAAERVRVHLATRIMPAYRRLMPAMNWAPQLAPVARSHGAEIIHAWGAEAAAVCSARLPDTPLLVTLLDPAAAREAAHRVRSFPRRATIAAGSQVLRARLVSAGMPADQVVVVRGPVDFGALNRARAAQTRGEVVGDARPVLLLNGPPSREEGPLRGIWAAGIVQQLFPDLKVLLPYRSRETRRLRRFAAAIVDPSFVIVPDPRRTWAELACCADVFLLPAVDEVRTEPLGVAMAAGLLVVGTAVRSITELIADRSNGLLCGRADPLPLAGRILTALEDAPLRRRMIDAARSQAFEIFSLRAFLENYTRLYENLVAGRPAGEAVRDTAMVA